MYVCVCCNEQHKMRRKTEEQDDYIYDGAAGRRRRDEERPSDRQSSVAAAAYNVYIEALIHYIMRVCVCYIIHDIPNNSRAVYIPHPYLYNTRRT